VDVSGVGRIRSSNKSKLSTEGKPERKCYFRRGRAKHEYREGTSASIRAKREARNLPLAPGRCVEIKPHITATMPVCYNSIIASVHLRSVFHYVCNNTRRLNALPQGWHEASSGHFSFALLSLSFLSLASLGFAHSYLHEPRAGRATFTGSC
jgi:hypothetical protein